MKMASRTELGVSSQEYEDGLCLEKIYAIVARNRKCSSCKKRNVTHVDPEEAELLCKQCARGTGGCKEIGTDRIRLNDVKQLEKKYRKSGGNVQEKSRSSRHEREKSRHRSKTPSVSTSNSSDSSEEVYQKHRTKEHSKRSNRKGDSHRHGGFSFDDFDDFFNKPSDDARYGDKVPGMRGILEGANAGYSNMRPFSQSGSPAQQMGQMPQNMMQQPQMTQPQMMQPQMMQPQMMQPQMVQQQPPMMQPQMMQQQPSMMQPQMMQQQPSMMQPQMMQQQPSMMQPQMMQPQMMQQQRPQMMQPQMMQQQRPQVMQPQMMQQQRAQMQNIPQQTQLAMQPLGQQMSSVGNAGMPLTSLFNQTAAQAAGMQTQNPFKGGQGQFAVGGRMDVQSGPGMTYSGNIAAQKMMGHGAFSSTGMPNYPQGTFNQFSGFPGSAQRPNIPGAIQADGGASMNSLRAMPGCNPFAARSL